MVAKSHEWIVDSGSSYDLVGESALTDEDKGKIQKGKQHRLCTANGTMCVDRELPVQRGTGGLVRTCAG